MPVFIHGKTGDAFKILLDSGLVQSAYLEVDKRRHQLRRATLLFASALTLAALSPLASLFSGPAAPVLHCSVDEKGVLEAGVEVSGMHEGSLTELSFDPNAAQGNILPKATTTIDRDGQAKLSLRYSSLSSLAPNTSLVLCVRSSAKDPCNNRGRIVVKP